MYQFKELIINNILIKSEVSSIRNEINNTIIESHGYLLIASSLSNNVSNNPPLASKHEEYKIVSSLSRNSDIVCSNFL